MPDVKIQPSLHLDYALVVPSRYVFKQWIDGGTFEKPYEVQITNLSNEQLTRRLRQLIHSVYVQLEVVKEHCNRLEVKSKKPYYQRNLFFDLSVVDRFSGYQSNPTPKIRIPLVQGYKLLQASPFTKSKAPNVELELLESSKHITEESAERALLQTIGTLSTLAQELIQNEESKNE